MFWGITLESGKKYTQVLQRSFHVTMAALGLEEETNSNAVSVVVDINNAQYVLCTLQSEKIPQQTLDLNFTEGEEVSFSIEGDGEVHLTGYLLPSPNEYELTSDDQSSSEEEKSDNEENSADEEDDYEKTLLLIQKDIKNQTKKKLKKKENVAEVSWQGALSGNSKSDEDDEWIPTQNKEVNVIQPSQLKRKDKQENNEMKSGQPAKNNNTNNDSVKKTKKDSPEKTSKKENEHEIVETNNNNNEEIDDPSKEINRNHTSVESSSNSLKYLKDKKKTKKKTNTQHDIGSENEINNNSNSECNNETNNKRLIEEEQTINPSKENAGKNKRRRKGRKNLTS